MGAQRPSPMNLKWNTQIAAHIFQMHRSDA